MGNQFSELIEKVASRSATLSECLVQARALAIEFGNDALRRFCDRELMGWDHHPDGRDVSATNAALYRQAKVFISATAEINPNAPEWAGDLNNALRYMDQHPEDFTSRKMFIGKPVGALEAGHSQNVPGALAYFKRTRRDFERDSGSPNDPVYVYMSRATYVEILEGLRTQLLNQLLVLPVL